MRDGEHQSAAPCVRFWAAPERHKVRIDPRQLAYSPRLRLPCTIAPPDANAGNLGRIHGDAGLTHRWVDPGPELRSTSLAPPCVGSSSCGDPCERQPIAKGGSSWLPVLRRSRGGFPGWCLRRVVSNRRNLNAINATFGRHFAPLCRHPTLYSGIADSP